MAEETEIQLQPLLDDELLEGDTDVIAFESQTPAILSTRRKRRRNWIAGISAVLVLGLIGSGLFYWQSTKTPAVQFSQAAAATGDLSVKVSATGPVNANALYNMNFATVGQVREIDVQVGQHVKQGQVLAKLNVDTTALQDALKQAQLGVTAAQVSLNAAGSSVSSAQSNLSKSQASNAAALTVAQDQEQSDLNTCATEKNPPANCQQAAQDKFAQAQAQISAGSTSAASQVTSAQNQVTSAQNNVDQAVARLQAAQHSLDSANANANLTAPVDATVASINGSIGQSIGSGSSSSSTSAFMVLTDTGKLSIAASVNEADIGNIQVGQPVQFSVASYPGSNFRASVAAINTIGQTTSNVVSYTVMLNVDLNSLNNQHLYPGMTATVNITTAQRIGTLLIPSSALSFPTIALQAGELNRSALVSALGGSSKGNATGQSKQRVVLELKNGKLTPVTVTTGLSSGQFTEILSGLNEGDQVVVGQTGGNTPTTTGSGGGGRGGAGGGGFGGGAGGGGVQVINKGGN